MQALTTRQTNRINHYRYPTGSANARAEILEGLLDQPKRINPKYFYDERGSLLFDQITLQPEYYPTRAENQILRRYCHAIANRIGSEAVLIEPGSGTSQKVELLLPAIEPSAYVPLDIASIHVRDAASRLAHRFPWLELHAIAADYTEDFQLPAALPAGKRVIFYPGSTIGNFSPEEAAAFLRRWRIEAGSDGGLLIGVDLDKEVNLLNNAYNDERGLTAKFNLNVLRHLNRLAGTDFDPVRFEHVAFFNEEQRRIEMHLESKVDQEVHCGDHTVELAAGERIHTENSYKYSPERFSELAAEAGWRLDSRWHDRDHLFGVFYFIAG